MLPPVMAWPHWLPFAAATSSIRLLLESALYRFPLLSTASAVGLLILAMVAGPLLPVLPPAPLACPATVYTSPAVIVIPNWVWLETAISWTRLLFSSAM